MRTPVLFLVLVFASSAVAQEAAKPEDPIKQQRREKDPLVAAAVEAIVKKTNQFRRSKKVQNVTESKQLTEAARYFADFMARTGKYGHTADDKTPAERAEEHGYEYCIILENIAYFYHSNGYKSQQLANEFFNGWKNSEEHRKNMLDADATQIGVALAKSEDNVYYAVQMFGRSRSDAIRFEINNQSDSSIKFKLGDRTVTLEAGMGSIHEMCRSQQVTLLWPDDVEQEETKITPQKGEVWTIFRTDDGKFTVEQKKSLKPEQQ